MVRMKFLARLRSAAKSEAHSTAATALPSSQERLASEMMRMASGGQLSSEDVESSLFSVSSADYGPSYREHLFEQYKLYVDSADRISQRRTSANSFFLTVNASLVTLYGLTSPLKAPGAWHLLVPLAGIFVCSAWFSLVEGYRNLNSAKFCVIHRLEQKLPAALYEYEWGLLREGKGDIYKPITHIEQYIPWIFILLYAGLFLYSWL